MEEIESVFDLETFKKDRSVEVRQLTKIRNILNKLRMYENNPQELTNIYTSIFEDDNVADTLTRLSKEKVFMEKFPELYQLNKYGENVLNCQQNSPYHKYGVFKHILCTMEMVGHPQIPIGDNQRKILKWTMFLHDIGKPYVKVIEEDGTDSFTGHDDKSVELANEILDRFYFSSDEKRTILTLIKYHDRYLNEGELTYDNLKFLASELDNSRDLFYLLIDVKNADASAKSIDVYNKFKLVKTKYLEFVNNYFSPMSVKTMIESEEDIVDTTGSQISNSEYDTIIDAILSKRMILNIYQPVIDLKRQEVCGYKVFTRIDYSKKVDMVEFLSYAKDGRYFDKVQQNLLINGIENFQSIIQKESENLFVISDYNSYMKYVNKPRIYDMMAKSKIVITFHGYEKKDLTEIQKTIDTIHRNKGAVAFDNFGVGSLTIDDLNLLNLDYIIPDMSLIENLADNEQKQKYISDLVTYCVVKDTELIIVGVEDKETLKLLQSLGVRYVQGYLFGLPKKDIVMQNNDIKELMNSINDEIIS